MPRALSLLCAAGAARVSGWAPSLQPAGAPFSFVRAGSEIDSSAFQLSRVPQGCPGGGTLYSTFTAAGARLTAKDGGGLGQLHLRGTINASADWLVLADFEAVPFPDLVSEGILVVVHNDARGAAACGAGLSCMAYTVDAAGPQLGVRGCHCVDVPPIAPSLAVAVSFFMGCMRLGVAGMFESAEACPSGNLSLSGAANLTLRVAYAAAPPAISGDLFFTNSGAAVPGATLRVPLPRPLAAFVAGPRALLAVGAASGYYMTRFTVTALGVFADAPINVSLASASASASPQGGSLPRAAYGDVAGPLAAGVAAAAALGAGAVAACRCQQRARRRAGASSGGAYKEVAETAAR
jgi:hypothetical protein